MFGYFFRRTDANIAENVSSNLTIPMNVDSDIGKEAVVILSAYLKVSSIAARGIRDVIKAQAGAPTTSAIAECASEEFSHCTKRPIDLAAHARARKIDENTVPFARFNRSSVVADLKPVAAVISR